MWVITGKGEALNLAQATNIYVEKDKDGNLYFVIAFFNERGVEYLKGFEDKEEAEVFVEMLADCLNGEKPANYAFTWLKKLDAKNAPVIDKLENEPKIKKGFDLVDGVPF